jgi:hypothetical protein
MGMVSVKLIERSVGQLYFTQNVSLTPQHNFGPDDHNVVIVVEPTKMLIWAGVVADSQNFNHCLEVPLLMINKILIKSRPDSQLSGVLNVHLFLAQIGKVCYLDCVGTFLSQICMVLQQSVVEAMYEEIRIICPHLEIFNEDENVPDRSGTQYSQENSQHMSQSLEVVHCSSNRASIVKPHYLLPTKKNASKGGSNTTHRESAGHIRKEIVILDGDDSNGPAGREVASNGRKTGEVTRPRPTLEIVKESTKENSPTQPILPQRKHARVPKPKAKMPLRQAQKSGTDIGQELDNADSVFAPDELVSKVLPPSNNSSDLKAQFAFPEASACREMVLAPNGNHVIATKLLNKNHNEGTWNPKLLDDALEIRGTLTKSTEIPKGTTLSDLETTHVTKDRIKRIVRVPDVTAVQGTQLRKNSLKRTLKDSNDDDCFEIPCGDVGESQVPPVEKDMSFEVRSAQSHLMSDKNQLRPIQRSVSLRQLP